VAAAAPGPDPGVPPTPVAPRTRRVPLLDSRVWLGLVAILVVMEAFTRVRLVDASKDFRRFKTYPERARVLVSTPAEPTSPALRLAFIGNSATDRGLDAQLVERGLASRGQKARGDLFVADQSRIDTWRFIFERYFAAPGLRPDLAVIVFYENDLEDGNPVEIGRLAQFFTRPRDWLEVMTVNLHSLDDRASFVISSFSATYAASERVRERLLAVLVPGFRPFSERTNQIVFEHARHAAAASAAPAAPTYVALQHLIDRAAQVGVRLCFVAYPTKGGAAGLPYEISPSLTERLRASGAPLVDLRQVAALRPELYADEVHLNEEGRAPFSEAMAAALASVVTR
jgi:hypothetical protein